jgi:probable F420-dependent oxidoreductase
VELGLVVRRPRLRPDALIQLVTRIEALGFHSFWMPDHIAGPAHIESSLPSRVGPLANRPGLTPDAELPDAMVMAAFVAAVTTRIRIGSAVIPLFTRDPVSLAKQAAMVDVLSNGRLELGIGAGWCVEEGQLLGHPTDHRWGRLNEAVDILRAAWSRPVFDYRGLYYQLPALGVRPMPPRGNIPIWIGGEGPAGVKLTLEKADGNILLRDTTLARVHQMRRTIPAPKRLAVITTLEDGIGPYVWSLADAGVDLLLMQIQQADLLSAIHEVEEVADVVLPFCARHTGTDRL